MQVTPVCQDNLPRHQITPSEGDPPDNGSPAGRRAGVVLQPDDRSCGGTSPSTARGNPVDHTVRRPGPASIRCSPLPPPTAAVARLLTPSRHRPPPRRWPAAAGPVRHPSTTARDRTRPVCPPATHRASGGRRPAHHRSEPDWSDQSVEVGRVPRTASAAPASVRSHAQGDALPGAQGVVVVLEWAGGLDAAHPPSQGR